MEVKSVMVQNLAVGLKKVRNEVNVVGFKVHNNSVRYLESRIFALTHQL